jgi:capsular exopolysaccharide synthesis family protein
MKLIEPPISHEYSPPPAEGDSGDLNVAILIRTVLRGLPIIFFGLIVGGGLGILALRYIPARYVSEVSILIDPKGAGSYGGDGQFTSVAVDSSKISDVELVLVSSELLGKVVDSEHLADQPGFGDAQPSKLRKWLSFLPSQPILNTPEARHMRAVERLADMIRTARVGITYVITLTVTAGDPALAQRLAHAVGEAYVNDEMDMKMAAVRRDTAWLTDQVKTQQKDLSSSEAAVESIRKKYGILVPGGGPETTVDHQAIGHVTEDLSRAEANVDSAEAKYQQALRVQRNGGDLEGIADVDSSKVVYELRAKQAELTRRVADLSTRYSTSFPERRQAERDLEAINGQVAREVSRVVDELRNDAQTEAANRDALRHQLNGLVGAVSATESAEGRVELKEAERINDANLAAYDASLTHLRQLEQQQSHQDAEARIISQAYLPEAPSFPKAPICIGAGGGLGLFAGLGLVFLFPYHRHRVVEIKTAERVFALPVMAMAPFLKQRDLKVGTFALSIPEYLVVKPMSPFAESLRWLRLHLQIVGKTGPRVVQVTSAVPGEGKSTIAAGLAVSAATAGIRTVIVDLDFHRPSIGKIFASQDAEGNFDVLLGSSRSGTELRRRETLPLRIIDAGFAGEPQPGMVESTRLRDLVKELQQEYDLVVLDTPPVLAITDPLFISGIADATVLVVAWGVTRNDMVDDALDALRDIRAPVVGIVLNKVKTASTGKYYAYAGYATA